MKLLDEMVEGTAVELSEELSSGKVENIFEAILNSPGLSDNPKFRHTTERTINLLGKLIEYNALDGYYICIRPDSRSPYPAEGAELAKIFTFLTGYLASSNLSGFSKNLPEDIEDFQYADICKDLAPKLKFLLTEKPQKSGITDEYQAELRDAFLARFNNEQSFDPIRNIIEERLAEKNANAQKSGHQKAWGDMSEKEKYTQEQKDNIFRTQKYLEMMLKRVNSFSSLCERAAASRMYIFPSHHYVGEYTARLGVPPSRELKTRVYDSVDADGRQILVSFNLPGDRNLMPIAELNQLLREKYNVTIRHELNVNRPIRKKSEYVIQPAHINPLTLHAFARDENIRLLVLYDETLFEKRTEPVHERLYFTNCGSPVTTVAFPMPELFAAQLELSKKESGLITVERMDFSRTREKPPKPPYSFVSKTDIRRAERGNEPVHSR